MGQGGRQSCTDPKQRYEMSFIFVMQSSSTKPASIYLHVRKEQYSVIVLPGLSSNITKAGHILVQ